MRAGFFFAGIQKNKTFYCASYILLFIVRDYGVHPRHSPRTFPLGLLAPRCLGLRFFSPLPALRSGCSGDTLCGGRKESFPQLRLVSAGLDQPAQPTPFLVFISTVCGVAFASDFCIARLRRCSSRPRKTGGVAGGTP